MKTINTSDKNLQLIQDNVAEALRPLESSALIGGTLLQGIDLKSGENKIPHKLDKNPSRWAILDITAAATIFRSGWDSKFINLQSSAPCTVALWVN